MAKSKSIRSSSANAEKISTNPLVQQWRGIRSEVAKVTWPTREEAQKLTIAVTIGMVAMALFLYAMDAIFQVVIGGVLDFNIVWIIASVVIAIALIAAFYTNGQED